MANMMYFFYNKPIAIRQLKMFSVRNGEATFSIRMAQDTAEV